MLKIVWGFISNNKSLWVRVLRAKHRWKEGEWHCNFNSGKGSPLWKRLVKIWQWVIPGLMWVVGDGRKLRFWEDKWAELEGTFGDLAVLALDKSERNCSVAE